MIRCCECDRVIVGHEGAGDGTEICFECAEKGDFGAASIAEKRASKVAADYGPLYDMLVAQGKIDPGCVR